MIITLRPTTREDEPFLLAVYASTRAEELAAFGWNDAQREAFLRMQFRAQQLSYQARAAQTDTKLILLAGSPAGRLIVTRSKSEIRLTDIALLPEYRGKGIGTALIKDLLAEATRAGQAVRLQVLKTNRAKRLYERLGFQTVSESATHFQMEWLPAAASSSLDLKLSFGES